MEESWDLIPGRAGVDERGSSLRSGLGRISSPRSFSSSMILSVEREGTSRSGMGGRGCELESMHCTLGILPSPCSHDMWWSGLEGA